MISKKYKCTIFDKSPTADVDQNYNIMYQDIHNVINKYSTMRTVKCVKHKHKKTNWITYDVLQSITYRDKLYKTLRKTLSGAAKIDFSPESCILLRKHETVHKCSLVPIDHYKK